MVLIPQVSLTALLYVVFDLSVKLLYKDKNQMMTGALGVRNTWDLIRLTILYKQFQM